MTIGSATSGEASLVRDVEYTILDFQRISDMLCSFSGIRMPNSNEALVFSRLSKRVKYLGYTRFSDYADFVESGVGSGEREEMIQALTTNTTRFFREAHHFDTVERQVMPGIVDRLRNNERIRFWSAGCSSGEEPYSLAASVVKSFPEVAEMDLKILATDIDKYVIKKAEEAEYRLESCESVSGGYASILFEGPLDGSDPVRVHPVVRSLVTFRYLNFIEPWPVRGPFTVIFCRNVMIYMEEETQSRIWSGLSSLLEPGGYLFIGHSERIGPEFKCDLEMVGNTTFRKL